MNKEFKTLLTKLGLKISFWNKYMNFDSESRWGLRGVWYEHIPSKMWKSKNWNERVNSVLEGLSKLECSNEYENENVRSLKYFINDGILCDGW